MPRRNYFNAILLSATVTLCAAHIGAFPGGAPELRVIRANAEVNEPQLNEAQIREAFLQLHDGDPRIRQSSRIRLMGMGRKNLETFEKIVREHQPLLPEERGVLRDIVMQVFLAGETYESSQGHRAFMGLAPTTVTLQDVIDVPGDSRTVESGVVISGLLPGFPAYRWLRDGDIILGIVERPIPVLTMQSFLLAMEGFSPGETVRVDVLRFGQIIRVPLTLVHRPDEVDPMRFEFEARRSLKFEEYWRSTFAPLLKQPVG